MSFLGGKSSHYLPEFYDSGLLKNQATRYEVSWQIGQLDCAIFLGYLNLMKNTLNHLSKQLTELSVAWGGNGKKFYNIVHRRLCSRSNLLPSRCGSRPTGRRRGGRRRRKRKREFQNKNWSWATVVAQSTDRWSHPTPEDLVLNLVIVKFYARFIFTV